MASLLLAACVAGEPAPTASPLGPTAVASPGTPASPAPTPVATPASAQPTIPVPSTTASTPPERPGLAGLTVSLERVAGGLDRPLFVTHAGDGSGRLFVVEQGGRVRIVREGRLVAAPFIDLADRITAGGERGLLGLAFPPGFGSEWLVFYVDYTDRSGDTIVAEYRVPAPGSDAADGGSERVILRVEQPYANHNGGWIGFDADGMLLVSLGDGGSGGDPEGRGQRLDTLLGKMLRVDVLGATGREPYRVPDDNPFLGRAGARPEILHYGLRNPWRASLDRATGDLWIGDVGQNRWEEVDVARRGEVGLNYGWNAWEGRHCYRPASGCDPTGITMPITEYGHGDGCAIVGGPVYRGAAIPALRGALLFGDACTGTIWAVDAALDAFQAPVPLLESGRRPGGFGEDEAGEVYLADLGGGVVRLAGSGG